MTGEGTLVCRGSAPNLKSTDEFQKVLQTLPNDSTVPMQILKLGLMSKQLAPKNSEITVEFSPDDVTSDKKAVVPPETLAAIPWILSNIIKKLNENEKKMIGKYCEVTELNRPPEHGNTIETVKESAPLKGHQWPDFFIRPEQNESNKQHDGGSANKRSSAEDNPFASGKEVTKRGGERITGKNPFADPNRLKDTGLHQGGG